MHKAVWAGGAVAALAGAGALWWFLGGDTSPTDPAPPAALVIEKHKLRGADGRNATVSMALFPFPADLS